MLTQHSPSTGSTFVVGWVGYRASRWRASWRSSHPVPFLFRPDRLLENDFIPGENDQPRSCQCDRAIIKPCRADRAASQQTRDIQPMLEQCPRRWSSTVPTSAERLVFAGMCRAASADYPPTPNQSCNCAGRSLSFLPPGSQRRVVANSSAGWAVLIEMGTTKGSIPAYPKRSYTTSLILHTSVVVGK